MEKVVTVPTLGLADPDAKLIVTTGRADTDIVTSADFVPPAVAETVAALFVVSVVRAMPALSVLTTGELKVPDVVVNVTGTPAIALPDASTTTALRLLVPPLEGTDVGLADTVTRPAAAAPTDNSNGSDAAPPEMAVIVAFPDWPLPRNCTVATPLSVRASTGETVPRFVVKVTVVPF
jgi:hypothetical protein